MKIFYVHGMGGGPGDFRLLPPGICPKLSTESFDKAVDELVKTFSRETQPFLVCGYSLGGRVAIAAAARMQDSPLRSLLLLSTGLGFASEEEKAARRKWDKDWISLANTSAELFWKEWYAQEIFSTFSRLSQEKKDLWMSGRAENLSQFCQELEALSPASHGHLLSELKSLGKRGVSTLYMAGEQDKKYARLARELEAHGIPVRIVEGGHILPLEAPEAVTQEIEKLIHN